jgi:transcriptional regulator with XRE-family HTH domain
MSNRVRPVETIPAELVIGRRLRRLRLAADRRAKEVAEAAGLTPAQLCDIEHGRIDPRWSLIMKILAALGCTLQDLVERDSGGRAA